MQVLIALSEASFAADRSYASLTRLVCGVPLLLRTLATAQRAGADDILVIAPECMPLAMAEAFVGHPSLQKKGNIRLLQVNGFDPDHLSSWIALQEQLEDRFIWLPWNWVTNPRLLARLPDLGQSHTDWSQPGWVSRSLPVEGQSFSAQPGPSPQAVRVTSDETAVQAERFLVAYSGKVSDGFHSSFNRRLCRPAVRWLTHTPVTPNAVTFGGVIVSMFAAAAFARGTYWSYALGALFFFIAGLFDEIDGMLARIKFADSPFGTYLESFADSVSYVLLFGGITIGLYRQHGVRELWVGGALLIGTVLALIVTTLQRKRAASPDRPTEYLGNFYRKLEQDSSNWISRAVRQAQGFQRRGIMIHYVVLLSVLGGVQVIFYLATLGSHLTWTLALYYNRRFFKQSSPCISLNQIHASQEAS
jgi:phosphatidylglycerophosphate synthase